MRGTAYAGEQTFTEQKSGLLQELKAKQCCALQSHESMHYLRLLSNSFYYSPYPHSLSMICAHGRLRRTLLDEIVNRPLCHGHLRQAERG